MRLLLFTTILFTTLSVSASSPSPAPLDSLRSHKADTAGHAMLTKKWVCVDISDPELKLKDMTKDQQALMKESYRKVMLEFRPDGSLVSILGDQEAGGTWELSYKDKKLAMISEEGVRDECSLIKLTPAFLTLKKEKTVLSFEPFK